MRDDDEAGIADVFVIGGGVNGCGIARDAAGRGLSVVLAEMGDLASATSSASTKLFHGGLRYLEYLEFRLVREALIERETLLRAMPHISWPLRFVLPYDRKTHSQDEGMLARLTDFILPHRRRQRPAWLIRFGLFLYDHLGGRKILPATSALDLRHAPEGAPLDERFTHAYEYSDCWIEDSRLVVLNARDAAHRGARIRVGCRVQSAECRNGLWHVFVLDQATGVNEVVRARAIVNAAGPWVNDVIAQTLHIASNARVRLVRGSHIVIRRLYDHDKCYFFQGTDGRIIFAIPYENDFTLIGTTDVPHESPDEKPVCTPEEAAYLCRFASRYFRRPVTEGDIVWTYSGLRALYDDGATSPTAATRDYVLLLDVSKGAPVLNVFGGKITTYRKLAEAALAKLAPHFEHMGQDWTAGVSLPGGDFRVDDAERLVGNLLEHHAFLTREWSRRLVRAYGTEAMTLLGDSREAAHLGRDFGATLTEAEVRWQMRHEFARCAEDVVWRRTRLGLKMSPAQIAALDEWMHEAEALRNTGTFGEEPET